MRLHAARASRWPRLQVAVQMLPVQMLPDGAVGGIWKQILTQLGVTQRLRLARQGADQVAIVDTTCPFVVNAIDSG